jgi:putative sigma-54 modulation protein
MKFKAELFAKNMEITQRINDYVMKKIAKIDRLLSGVEEARIDLSYVKSARNAADRQVAQITVHGKGFILRTEERSDDIFAAIDASMDKLTRQIERYKGKHHRGRGDGTPASEVAEVVAETEDIGTALPAIVRRKQFTLVPMGETEALEQMLLLGHENFFVFYNAETNSINVIYRRRDGTYGLIEPQIG